MGEFKGTKGKLERVYVSGICIGIGAKTQTDEFEEPYFKLTANSIIPDTGNKREMDIMEADMLLYSKAPKMLAFLEKIVSIKSTLYTVRDLQEKANDLIREATESNSQN